MAEAIGLIGPAISGASALMGLAKGSPASNVQIPTQYPGVQLPSTQAAAGQLLQGAQYAQGLYNPLFQGLNQYGGGTLADIYANPGMAGYTGGAGTAADIGQRAAMAQYLLGGNLAGMGTQAMMTGFDPQGALYGRTAQQLQDQVRAAQAQRGIAMTPYGAGLENQALSNFNIDWQNQQLQRQLAALQGGGGAYQTGAGLMGGAAPGYLSASAMPYGAYQNIYGNQLGALGQVAGLYGQGEEAALSALNPYQAYMQAGLGASQNAAQFAQNAVKQQLDQATLGFNQNQTMGQQFGQALQGLGKGWPAFSSALGWGK